LLYENDVDKFNINNNNKNKNKKITYVYYCSMPSLQATQTTNFRERKPLKTSNNNNMRDER